MEAEEKDNFSEFENIKPQYRRSLLPWWIWAMLWVYIAINFLRAGNGAVQALQGYPFNFDLLRIYPLIPYPYNTLASVLLFLFLAYTFILLWTERKQAAVTGLVCFGLLLGLCVALLIAGMLKQRFYLRVETIIFLDIILRLSDKRKDWEQHAVPRGK